MPQADSYDHDVFISYSTVASAQLGAAVEQGLVTFGKPWDSPRALNVFRDVSEQPATIDLAAELMAHLDASDWLIYLASPEAAASYWVRAEIEHWLSARGPERLLLGIGSGEIGWDAVLSRFTASTSCLPPELLTTKSMPKWVDFREAKSRNFSINDEWFRDKIADFSSKVRDIPKAYLVGLHWREHRKGLARRIAQHADMMIETNASLALQMAATANELDDVPETRNTLSSLLEYSSGTTSVEGSHGIVTAIAAFPGPGTEKVVLAHADGMIDVLTPAAPVTHATLACPRPGHGPTALGISQGGLAAGYLDGFVACHGPDVKRIIKVMDEPVLLIAPDETLVHVACASHNKVIICTVESGELRELSCRHLLAMRWTGDELWIGDWADLLRYDLSEGQLTKQGQLFTLARPGPRAITPSFKKMAVGQLDGGAVTVWPVPYNSSSLEGALQGPPGFMDGLAIDAPGEHVAVATGGRLLVWALSSPQTPVLDQQGLPRGLSDLLVGEDGSWVVARGTDKCQLRTSASSTLTRQVPFSALDVPSVIQAAMAVAFSPDGQLVAWVANPSRPTSERPTISTWDISGWFPGPSVSLPITPIGLAFSESRKLIAEGYKEVSYIWNLNTDKTEVTDLPATFGLQTRLRPEATPAVEIYEEGKLIDEVTWPGKDWPASYMVPSGRLVPVAFRSGRLLLRDVETRTDLWSVETATFHAVACSPDERIVAGVTQGGRLLLMDAPSGGIMARLEVPASQIHKLAFAPSGLSLACAGVGGVLTLINTDTTSWRYVAETRAGGRLPSSEQQRLGLDQIYLP
ncbi:hypothetical protein [Arthrobacter sp. 754]|uniref:hypothetical protein n=1 Tax=Arthrobacter sp. 754 TaxID=3156315 RepID=UPI003393C23D